MADDAIDEETAATIEQGSIRVVRGGGDGGGIVRGLSSVGAACDAFWARRRGQGGAVGDWKEQSVRRFRRYKNRLE